MKVSIVMSSFCRSKLLDLGLWSLAIQKLDYDLEVIIVNDGIKDNTENICNKWKNKLNIRYIFTGHRNKEVIKFRSPSIALNIGIRQAKGDTIILSCPEILHLNNTINLIVEPMIKSKKIMSTPNVSFDNSGRLTEILFNNQNLKLVQENKIESETHRCRYASRLPFCLGIYKKEIVAIGGYDEDFTGWACDDDDIVGRLVLNGLAYNYTNAKIIHLYHGKQYDRTNRNKNKNFIHNSKLYNERKGIIIRNKNREWGKL